MEAEHVEEAQRVHPGFVTALLAGAASGLSVDLLFFPIDTIKTRLQSAEGFWRSGGFAGVYRGMGSVAVGSAPGASIFFVTYEMSKSMLARVIDPDNSMDAKISSPAVHMAAGTIGEIAACMVRVPTEVIKSRQQTSAYGRISSFHAFRHVVAQEGVRGLYRGYGSTIFREVGCTERAHRPLTFQIPFTCIQFPLYEFLKQHMAGYKHEPTWWQAASSGSIAGAVAAAVTTPLDVIKTRIMLSKVTPGTPHGPSARILPMLSHVIQEGGIRALFAGVAPRTLWIGVGGAVFLGTFDATAKLLERC